MVRGQIPFTEEELAVKEEKITTQPLLTAPSLPVIDENSDWGVGNCLKFIFDYYYLFFY